MPDRKLMLLAGNSNQALWDEIAAGLRLPLTKATVGRFADEEIKIQIEESMRGAHCFVLQSTCRPVNTNLVETLLLIDALRRASPGLISVVMPYYGYARQDKKTQSREPISARAVAEMIEHMGAQRVLAVDLHSDAIQGFFNIPVDHLPAVGLLCDRICSDGWAESDCVVVSPDVGGVARAKRAASRLGLKIAIIVKERPSPNEAEIVAVIGDVKGKRALMFDDMIDTAGSVVNGAEALMREGAKQVRAYATHGVFGGQALTNIQNSVIEQVTVTNTIPPSEGGGSDKIVYVSIANLLAQAIRLNYRGESVSALCQ